MQVNFKHVWDNLYSLYLLGLFSLIYTLNQIDRSLVSVFAVPMKRELQISDTNFGWLTGFMFSLLLTLFGIIFGYLGDRYNRKITLSLCILMWSICTVFSGFSKNFWQLLLSRMGLAIGEAAFTPLALSILSSYFSQDYKSIVVSIYNFGIYFGFGFSFLFGLIPQWRLSFWILGGVGVISTVLCALTVVEPEREPLSQEDHAMGSFKYILSKPSFYLLAIACGFQYMAGLSYGSWISVFFSRIHNQNAQDLAKWIPWIIPVFGCVSMLIGGFLGDFLHRFTIYGRLILTCVVSLLVLIPTIPLFLVDQVVFAYILMIPKVLIGEIWISNSIAVLTMVSPKKFLSSFLALYFLIGNLIGGMGPVIVGALTDYFGPNSIRYTLMSLMIAGYSISCIFYTLAIFFLKRDVKIKQDQEIQ